MTDNTQPQPEALRLAEQISDIRCQTEGEARAIAAAADLLCRRHARIAELESELEASHALDAHSIRVHRKRDGLLMVNARGKSRFMTLRERIAYWLLGNTTEIRP